MDDDRFNLLKDHEVKNKRGRKWVDIPNNNESSDDSDCESITALSCDSSDGSYMEINEDDAIDVDFDNLVNDAESTTDSTDRLAVMHFDFDQYPLSYLAMIIKSALPKNGKIKSITKYPSNDCMERYYEDMKNGPKEYLRSENDKEYDSDESGDSIEACKAMRNYQISRLKFFYAIFEFDSIETADCIYNTLDNKNLGDSGLKLDLRYVDPDRKFEIPENFLHLVEKLRPNSSKFKGAGFKPSCFSEIKVRDTWDVLAQKEEFNARAFEGTDNELSDAEDFYKDDTASEYSASEAESKDESDNEGPKVKRYRRERIPVDEYRAKFGFTGVDEDNEDMGSDEDEDDEDEEVVSIGGSGDESAMGSGNESHDEYVIDEAADEEDDKMSESEDENENKDQEKKSKQAKKVSHKEKMKSILKEKAEKKSRKLNEERDYLKSIAETDDRFDEFLHNSKNFAIIRTHSKYDKAKLFLEMMDVRANKLNIKRDFIVPGADIDQTEDHIDQSAPARKKRKTK